MTQNIASDQGLYLFIYLHCENTLIQIYRKFHLQKLKISKEKTDIFHISAQNIDCGYTR